MPELPDLQVFSKNLRKRIAHREIVSAEVLNRSRVNVDGDIVRTKLLQTRIADIVRKGKELYFQLENDETFSVHLMLSGKFHICAPEEAAGIPYKILSVGLEGEEILVISDLQSLCKVTFNPMETNTPDALGENFTFTYLLNAVRRNQRKNIKAFLIDQSIIKGIGNAYADEILWKANISPKSTAGKIPEDRLNALYTAISDVLKDAVANIERISPDIISGEERSFLRVHNFGKKYTDEGDRILIQKIAAKTTYYTERQQLFL
ncbi:MAG: formamidopyrimidine-DNA glycosylase [Lachnospiraceae bacterium]|nr:DNA-formamidopyrimidine glycosylase family protein [uncultured Acetatifactor sp.]MCI8286856.1 formamidopyrimidine-DNA glycosylase [Lachnospiraceae bacterium]